MVISDFLNLFLLILNKLVTNNLFLFLVAIVSVYFLFVLVWKLFNV